MLKLLRNHYKNGSTREPVPPEPFQEAKEGIGHQRLPPLICPPLFGAWLAQVRATNSARIASPWRLVSSRRATRGATIVSISPSRCESRWGIL